MALFIYFQFAVPFFIYSQINYVFHMGPLSALTSILLDIVPPKDNKSRIEIYYTRIYFKPSLDLLKVYQYNLKS